MRVKTARAVERRDNKMQLPRSNNRNERATPLHIVENKSQGSVNYVTRISSCLPRAWTRLSRKRSSFTRRKLVRRNVGIYVRCTGNGMIVMRLYRGSCCKFMQSLKKKQILKISLQNHYTDLISVHERYFT